MEELHLTKKDFDVQWYSGTGAGGQHRNRHMNSCRIVHKATGITAHGTSSRTRIDNLDRAFKTLVSRLIAYLNAQGGEPVRVDSEVIRLYHEPRNQVKDLSSGFIQTYKEVVRDGEIGAMIEARKRSMKNE